MKWFRLLALLVVAAAVMVVGGCVKERTTTLVTTDTLTGNATSNGSQYSFAPSSDGNLGYYYRTNPDVWFSHNRTLLSFALPPELAGTVIKSAKLNIYCLSLEGLPFNSCGVVNIVPVQFDGSTGAQTKYSACTVGDPALAFSTATASSWTQIDVTDMVSDAVAGSRSYAQFRLQHQAELLIGEASNRTIWETSSSTDPNHATLAITYVPVD